MLLRLRLSTVKQSIMKSFLFSVIIASSLISCAQPQNKSAAIVVPVLQPPVANEAVANFSEGCFWHAEIVFQSLKGVRDAVSGYAGGTVANPDYETVCTGKTGHAETVQVFYDPSVISYENLVKAFFASQDPTTLNRQGNDVGTEYRSIAFYRNEKEKATIEAEIKRLTAEKAYSDKIVTEILPFKNFYKAEDYHQEYISLHPDNPYVQNVSVPDFNHFRNLFKGNFKK